MGHHIGRPRGVISPTTSGPRRKASSAEHQAFEPGTRLQAVLGSHADICRKRRRHRDDELAAVLHRSTQVRKLRRQLLDLISTLMADAAGAGAVRHDVPAEELASYCVHALAAAGNSSTTAMDRLSTSSGPESPTPSTQTHGVDSAPQRDHRTDEHQKHRYPEVCARWASRGRRANLNDSQLPT